MVYVEGDPLLSERELSRWLGISAPTLFRHRRDGTGPNFIRLSARRVAYRRSAVENWLRAREQRRIDLPDDEEPHKRVQTDDSHAC
jgi:predicted DNA-binding transcriptional regulator AlpA